MSQLLGAGGAWAASRHAEVVMLNAEASQCAIFQALSPQVPPQCQTQLRTVVLLAPSAPPAALSAIPLKEAARPPEGAAPKASTTAEGERVYAFTSRIQFASDSTQLTPESRRLLDTLAGVLKDTLLAKKIIHIEGHTDSLGSDEYNLQLSYRRAMSVQRYLSERGVPTHRIPVIGKGKAEPYDPANPLDAVNRRVQFVNISDSKGRP